jgi:hypothetical protein
MREYKGFVEGAKAPVVNAPTVSSARAPRRIGGVALAHPGGERGRNALQATDPPSVVDQNPDNWSSWLSRICKRQKISIRTAHDYMLLARNADVSQLACPPSFSSK